MGLFSKKPKQPQEQTIVQLRTDIYTPQPGEDLSRLEHAGYTAEGEPIFRWRPPDNHVDKKVTLEKEK